MTNNNITKTYFKTTSAEERQFIARFTDCPTDTIKDVVAYAGKHLDECIALHDEFLLIARSNANAKKAEKEIEAKAEVRAKALEALNKKAEEAKAGETAKTDKPKDRKPRNTTPKTVKLGRTGTFDDATTELAAEIEAVIPDYAQHVNIHGDAKKRKLMIRYDGKLLTKVFIQKGTYKMHFKTMADYEAIGYDTSDVFFQNGFNLAYAKKVSKAVFLGAIKLTLKNAALNTDAETVKEEA